MKRAKMKRFRPITALLLSISPGIWSCNAVRRNERTAHKDTPAETFNLVGQSCQSSFVSHPGIGDQDEIIPPEVAGIDMAEVEQLLTGDGIVGHMHAAIPEYGTWVFNYQKGSVFNSYQFPMAISDPDLLEMAMTLKRHDKVKLTGSIAKIGAAQKHILVTGITISEVFKPTGFEPNYSRTQTVPNELIRGNSAIVGVHSISADGLSLTVEYRDFVVQVVVKNPELTKGLYRNDKIRISYHAVDVAGRPLHLVLDESAVAPLEMLDAIVDLHSRNATAEGCLVFFPKSPQITRDIYALLEIDKDGVTRTWTLANFVDSEVFAGISSRLAEYWNEKSGSAINFRNKMLNTGIHVTATGTLNISSPNQANPQILISTLDDLKLAKKD
jgi:hypothetical protein